MSDYRFDDPRYTYGNWNEPHLYYCVRCQDRTQPPVGVIELLDEEGSPTGDFQPLCWKHMAVEAQGWVRFLGNPYPSPLADTAREVLDDVYEVVQADPGSDIRRVHIHDLIDIERKWGVS